VHVHVYVYEHVVCSVVIYGEMTHSLLYSKCVCMSVGLFYVHLYMYVCCVPLCNTHVIRRQTTLSSLYSKCVCMSACMCMCMCMCICICTCMCICVCICMCMCMGMLCAPLSFIAKRHSPHFTNMSVCVRDVCVCVCICASVRACLCLCVRACACCVLLCNLQGNDTLFPSLEMCQGA